MLNNPTTETLSVAGHEVSLTTGSMAKQANGSVVLKCNDMVLLATVAMSKSPKEGIDFFPLMVEYSEKMYSAGKIPGGFFKREARPSTLATLTSRLIDRPLRPSFPKNIYNDVQVIITVLSYDPSVPAEPMAIVAASAAISVSDIPFNGPVGSVIIGQINGEFIVNPSSDQQAESTLNIVVAGNKEAILMVESESKEVSEETIIEAILLGHEHIKETITLQENLVAKAGKEKLEAPQDDPELAPLCEQMRQAIGTKVLDNLTGSGKEATESFLQELAEEIVPQFVNEDESNKALVSKAFNTVKKEQIRKAIITNKVRPDGRAMDEIRQIEVEAGVLPTTHGSSLFTRGETQSLGVVTLGTPDDEQIVDGLEDSDRSSYYFHYNFPPYSVGETGRLSTGRRELGHGALAERALRPILPQKEDFPYTIRIVSEILESNGSSSMASVCSGALSLMDAGVPIKSPVSGIAMGLLLSEDGYSILSDIQGLEDHYGDMDFKVAGTEKGITALQLDIKISGLSKQILEEALAQAKRGRAHILNEMNSTISEPRGEISPNAPKIFHMKIPTDKVGLVIGPGGKMIRKIEEDSGAKVVITDGDDGDVCISGPNQAAIDIAHNIIKGLTEEPEVGTEYEAKVVKIMNFGAFVEFMPGKEGLIHISNLADRRVERVEDEVSVGDTFKVKLIKIDEQNRCNLAKI